MSKLSTTLNKIRLSERLLEPFKNFHKAIKQNYLYYILKGGRGSSKSTHISIELVLRRMSSKSHAIVIRKYAAYLERSVFEQLKWAIEYLEVGQYWHIKKSPITLTYTPTGASIIFAGADDPQKIKSIKMSDMPITDLWVEECAEFKTKKKYQRLSILLLGLNYLMG